MSLRICLLGLLMCCWACNNIEDAKPENRNTFIRFYEAAHNVYGITAEEVDGGFVILGNELLANGNQNSLFIRTNEYGEKIADDVVLPDGYAKGLKVASDGYYIIGDSIKSNLESSDISVYDLVVYSARLFKLDLTGTIVKKVVLADKKNSSNITDIHGGSVTLGAQNEVIVLGSFKNAGLSTTERPYLAALDPSSLDTIWSKTYDVLDRDYVNSKSLHIAPSGKIIWATALLKENQNFSRSYLGIPYIQENSTFENFSQYGEQTDQQLYANDIQPSESVAFGYGVIGTYASPTGANGNMFFIRVNQQGNIIEGSERYFDGERFLTDNTSVNAEVSSSDDTGDALTSTRDGGFILAGTVLTTPSLGKGGKDILLVKIDSQGNVQWTKILGGSGNETVNSIRETSDGGLLICGSNDLSGLSSIFIMKTDMNGELKD
ncbi:hypothetical protein [Ohtaekwangia koreensis]|uniref:Delta-60 repeat domain-containing protein n=1 Tax=Ohtaekwangia koreensis TaxID=688867 RepID=A0A1T5MFN0_9BACT|nr:hypothetical protein [Ohtaekwangia koreensis]SKC87040.1 hypothetical protein SAMN05660236_5318 [Ohtaekwangia koreensis]